VSRSSGSPASRDVISVIVAFRAALTQASADGCPEVAAEYLCDPFDGSAAAINVVDYRQVRYQTIVNVGRLCVSERTRPSKEFYAFADFPFTGQQLARGGSYRSSLEDPACPPEYRELLSAQQRSGCLGAPIRLAGRPRGEFWVTRDSGRPFAATDEDLAVACGATLARYFQPAWAAAS